MSTATLITGDAATALDGVPDRSCAAVVTSPPYYRLRKYTDDPREIGRDGTVARYLPALVETFAMARQKLIRGGVLFVNIGDTYNAYNRNRGRGGALSARRDAARSVQDHPGLLDPGSPNKSLLGVPERLAAHMIGDGWVLRASITWARPTLPERVTDRPRRASERLLMFAERPRNVARRPATRPDLWTDIWELPSASGSSQHPARFAPALPEACLSWVADTDGAVLDPFSGSGATGIAAATTGRDYYGIDLSGVSNAVAAAALAPYFSTITTQEAPQ